MIGQHEELCRRKRLALYFSLIGCITFRVALSRGFLHHVSCRVSCPVASSWELALPAVSLALPAVLQQQQQLVTSSRAAYHPRASSCFFFFASNIFTVQPLNFNDGNTLTPTVGLQPFATGMELLRQLDLSPHTIVQSNTTSAMLL